MIDSSTLFQVRVTLAGKRSELYPGRYTLAEGMSYGAAIDALSQPPVKRTITVTIPEGYSRSQAAQLAEEVGLKGDYTDGDRALAVSRPGQVRRRRREEPRGLPLSRTPSK